MLESRCRTSARLPAAGVPAHDQLVAAAGVALTYHCRWRESSIVKITAWEARCSLPKCMGMGLSYLAAQAADQEIQDKIAHTEKKEKRQNPPCE